MSEDVFSICVALKLQEPVDRNDLYDTLYDYLDDTYGAYVYSIHFGDDIIALYHDQEYGDNYGITRIDITKDFSGLLDILATLCEKHEILVDFRPKYFTDFWYNGTDCSVTGKNWEDL